MWNEWHQSWPPLGLGKFGEEDRQALQLQTPCSKPWPTKTRTGSMIWSAHSLFIIWKMITDLQTPTIKALQHSLGDWKRKLWSSPSRNPWYLGENWPKTNKPSAYAEFPGWTLPLGLCLWRWRGTCSSPGLVRGEGWEEKTSLRGILEERILNSVFREE